MKRPVICHVSEAVNKEDAVLYKKLHALHCKFDGDKEMHTCRGQVILDHAGITVTCPICGDARQHYAED